MDQRGSELLQRAECRRLLAVAAGGVAHLGLIVDGKPVVVPVNYIMLDRDVLLRLGPGSTLEELGRSPIVALEVDHVPSEGDAWSVVVQGVATPLSDPGALQRAAGSGLVPLVPEPGREYVQVRTGVLSGRRFSVGARANAETAVAGQSTHAGDGTFVTDSRDVRP
jgi:nitroimidazol reductase NimA-like FMN-containing flavoprotein (pyridoxamine 5'-phosphate oxidase superfamily)